MFASVNLDGNSKFVSGLVREQLNVMHQVNQQIWMGFLCCNRLFAAPALLSLGKWLTSVQYKGSHCVFSYWGGLIVSLAQLAE